jgi:hypothetical protein
MKLRNRALKIVNSFRHGNKLEKMFFAPLLPRLKYYRVPTFIFTFKEVDYFNYILNTLKNFIVLLS